MYGAEHLLRLFVKLPYLLEHTDISDEDLSKLHAKIMSLAKHMKNNYFEFFTGRQKYRKASAGYTDAYTNFTRGKILVTEAVANAQKAAAEAQKAAATDTQNQHVAIAQAAAMEVS